MHTPQQTAECRRRRPLVPATTRSVLSRALGFGLAALISFGSGTAHAALTTYTTEASWLSAVTNSTLVSFDNLPDGTAVSNQYAGVSFSAFNGGNPRAMAYIGSYAGPNLLSLGTPPLTGGGGGVAIDFTVPQQGVGFWYLDSEIAGNGVTVYGTANQVLGTYEMAFPRPFEWLFVGFTASANDITRIEVVIDAADMVALDSLQFSAPVPEPAAFALLLAGLALLVGTARHAARGRH